MEIRTEIVESNDKEQSYIQSYFTSLRWNFHDPDALENAENDLFSNIKSPFKRFNVKIGKCVSDDDQIWTFAMNQNSKNVPIVLIHGFGAGVAFWALNVEELAKDHPVYAFDVLGCSRSSRSHFSDDAHEIENQFIDSIDKWRAALNIDKMILIGHSFGGFLSSCYALKYPERLEHLILVDAWGHDETPDLQDFPLWKLSVAYSVRMFYGPFSMLRTMGPFGESLVKTIKRDLLDKFGAFLNQSSASQYIYHCNNQTNPTGEIAFHRMTIVGPWPINPVGERMREKLCSKIPVSFFYGSLTWMSRQFGLTLSAHRGEESYTKVETVENSGHHIYLETPGEFNRLVLEACKVLKSEINK